ncbi:sulfur carrier protein ThiS [Corynebacterium liangguodongii]|uniref:Thiamine biosynthesis protein ThiS n=1 Tax=Corynebacterium liangguodongii TaxID=2079535 RepID=A0A2S0WCU3_9CORY|nr:sulfur carrier protein ThiS [Corynebacterium liangguodongii]AWB83585.1 thiamine biosynthesis protein ThiS [Corynebacterium liangguodongii]PWB98623.1 thiamine biosynthesis protein ThiS [Corynebacterium liangguodongii]
MHITVNGEARETAATTVEELVVEEVGQAPGAGTAVAIDAEVVPRSEWGSTRVAEGSRVDILTAVQGG